MEYVLEYPKSNVNWIHLFIQLFLRHFKKLKTLE